MGIPGVPPEMRFLTPICHANVSKNGKICHAIFTSSYTPETTIREIFNQVYSLLLIQDFDDYVVSNLHIKLNFNKDQFREKARLHTQRYAIMNKTKDQLIREMLIEDDCPEEYRCALTKGLMRDPVYFCQSLRRCLREWLLRGILEILEKTQLPMCRCRPVS